MKKGFWVLSEPVMLALEIILLVIGVIALVKVIGAIFNPDKQIVLANTELLRAKMNEACLKGKAEIEGFSFPQPFVSKLGGLTDFLPGLAMLLGGDPHYVLYYEAFPPGEAIGWEVYLKLQHRIVAPLPDNFKGTEESVFRFIEKVKNDVRSYITRKFPDEKIDELDVIVPNIILDDEVIEVKKLLGGEKSEKLLGTTGRWQRDEYGNIQPYYAFSNYFLLNPLKKTSVKYRACGKNSLCLKTREGVIKFPLDYCKEKIKYVQFVRKTYATGLVTVLRAHDFYIVSPCTKFNMKITREDDCKKGYETYEGEFYFYCTKWENFPLYRINRETRKIENTGKRHWYCLDHSVNDVKEMEEKLPCLKVVMDYSGRGLPEYCSLPESTPVGQSTYYSDNKFILKPTEIMKDFLKKFQRKFAWGWSYAVPRA